MRSTSLLAGDSSWLRSLSMRPRGAAAPAPGIALGVPRGEVGVDPAPSHELVVDERPWALVEVTRGDRRRRHVVPCRDEVRHLHALTLAHGGRARRDALGGTVRAARLLRAVTARGEVSDEHVDRADRVIDAGEEHTAEVADEPMGLEGDGGVAGQDHRVVDPRGGDVNRPRGERAGAQLAGPDVWVGGAPPRLHAP